MVEPSPRKATPATGRAETKVFSHVQPKRFVVPSNQVIKDNLELGESDLIQNLSSAIQQKEVVAFD